MHPVRLERDFRHRETDSRRLWPDTSDQDLLIERRVLRALTRCDYDYGGYEPECIYYRATVSLDSVPGVRAVARRVGGSLGADVCAAVQPRWIEVERRGLAVVDGSLVLWLGRPDFGYDVIAARQLEGFFIRPWPASVVVGPRGRRRLLWREGASIESVRLIRPRQN